MFYFIQEMPNSYVNHYPFVSPCPWATMVLIGAYLYLIKFAAPSFMKLREPLNINSAMIYYNFLIASVSAWMFSEMFFVTNFASKAWSLVESERVNSSTDLQGQLVSRRIGFVLWVFFVSKFIEFSDTAFMVLRKKEKQVTKLHLVHHCIAPISVWYMIKYAPVPINLWFPMLNSFVHTFMYSYYGLMAINDSLGSEFRRKVMSFKPWVTRFQLVQFLLVIIHCFYLVLTTGKPGVPWAYILPNLGNALLFLILFSNFYYETYVKKGPVTASLAPEMAQNGNFCQTNGSVDTHECKSD